MNQKILMNTNFLRKNKKEKENETTKKLPHSTCANWKCRRSQIIWRFSWSILAVISSDVLIGTRGQTMIQDAKPRAILRFQRSEVWWWMGGHHVGFLSFIMVPFLVAYGDFPPPCLFTKGRSANGWLLPIGRKLLSICWYTTEVFIGFCLKTQDWWWATTLLVTVPCMF